MKKNQPSNSGKKPRVVVARAETRVQSGGAQAARTESKARIVAVVWPTGETRGSLKGTGEGGIYVRVEARTRREPRTAVEKF